MEDLPYEMEKVIYSYIPNKALIHLKSLDEKNLRRDVLSMFGRNYPREQDKMQMLEELEDQGLELFLLSEYYNSDTWEEFDKDVTNGELNAFTGENILIFGERIGIDLDYLFLNMLQSDYKITDAKGVDTKRVYKMLLKKMKTSVSQYDKVAYCKLLQFLPRIMNLRLFDDLIRAEILDDNFKECIEEHTASNLTETDFTSVISDYMELGKKKKVRRLTALARLYFPSYTPPSPLTTRDSLEGFHGYTERL